MRKVFRFLLLASLVWLATAGQAQAQFAGWTRDCWAVASLPIDTLDTSGTPVLGALAQKLTLDPNSLGAPTSSTGASNFEAPQNVSGKFVCRLYAQLKV